MHRFFSKLLTKRILTGATLCPFPRRTSPRVTPPVAPPGGDGTPPRQEPPDTIPDIADRLPRKREGRPFSQVCRRKEWLGDVDKGDRQVVDIGEESQAQYSRSATSSDALPRKKDS